MFAVNCFFNQDVSAWNVENLSDMTRFLFEAAAFDQDLCTWGDVVSSDLIVKEAFDLTACEFTDDPLFRGNFNRVANGPFCAPCESQQWP